MKKQILHEAIGWYGALAIMLGYILISFEILTAQDPLYQILNITGGLGLVHIGFVKHNIQSAIVNIIFSLIGCVALIRILYG